MLNWLMLRTEDSDDVADDLTIDIDTLNNNAGGTDNTVDDINMNCLPSSSKYCRAQSNIRAD